VTTNAIYSNPLASLETTSTGSSKKIASLLAEKVTVRRIKNVKEYLTHKSKRSGAAKGDSRSWLMDGSHLVNCKFPRSLFLCLYWVSVAIRGVRVCGCIML
jgi:hypothetical protein